MRNGIGDARPLRVLVAGGAGFVGSHLCEVLLERGCDVICLDSFLTGRADNVSQLREHPRFALIEQDVCHMVKIEGPVHRVYNLACAASPDHYQADPTHTMMTCVLGTRNLLSFAARKAARYLQASTSEIYGDPEEHPQRESYVGHVSCTGPRACYDEGKRAAETLCFDALRQDEADIRVARIFNTYGPRMRPDDGRIISNLAVQALTDAPLTIYGSGLQTRSFCYVSDLVRGLIALMEVGPNPQGPVNLGNPGEFSILELAELVLKQTGSSSRLTFKPLPQDDPRRRRPDIQRAKRLLNWEPTIPLHEGLQATIASFQAHLQSRPHRNPASERDAAVLTGRPAAGRSDAHTVWTAPHAP